MTIKQFIINIDDDPIQDLTHLGDIYALGIQGTPGTTFHFTGNNNVRNDPITIGPSGIFQINLSTPIINGIVIDTFIGTLPIIIDVILEEQLNG